uniref:M23 family metallopeptidase n=1 Tax=Thaumasiovibrio occultus TaxID=1891184 RepID=UPI000B355CC6|nr:M23 family metallopeptidase [Thaumasiovibrio occultus]
MKKLQLAGRRWSEIVDCHPWFKTYTISAIVVCIALTLGTIGRFQLHQTVLDQKQRLIEQQQRKLQAMQTANATLQATSHQQLDQLKTQDEQLLIQQNELLYLNDRLVQVEQIMGISEPGAESTLEQRVDAASINSAVRSEMLRAIPSGEPIAAFRRSSGYGRRVHPVTGQVRHHSGLDLTAEVGTEVYAPADGVVELTRRSRTGYGNMVRIQHAFGFTTVYAHLKDFDVKQGEFVAKGQRIAWSGNTGLSTGPHLHYEVRFLNKPYNPTPFIKWSAEDFGALFESNKSIAWADLVDTIATSMEVPVELTIRNGESALTLNVEALTPAEGDDESETPDNTKQDNS